MVKCHKLKAGEYYLDSIIQYTTDPSFIFRLRHLPIYLNKLEQKRCTYNAVVAQLEMQTFYSGTREVLAKKQKHVTR